MRGFAPVVFDATHSLQLPGGLGHATGGAREFHSYLARAAAGAGVDGFFVEVHPNPSEALSDATTQLSFDEFDQLIENGLLAARKNRPLLLFPQAVGQVFLECLETLEVADLLGQPIVQRRQVGGAAGLDGQAVLFGSVFETLDDLRAAVGPGVRITSEARDAEEARQAVRGGADVVLLDNMTPGEMAALAPELRRLASGRERPLELEASGGISRDDLAAVACSGVDRISVGSLTHSVSALDVSLYLESAP